MIQSAEEFIRLRSSEDPDEQRRASAASASLEVWRDIVDRHPEARFWVAQNKTVPLEILRTLATDPDPKVRSMVAMKRKVTPDILADLAGDPNESVRLTVARHRLAPRSVLERLLFDSWAEIREVARDRIENEA
ncbi:hypothetical protein [Streptomyces sp. NPDC051636]|uniref:hypothetical protein n=1 Tax=Streptomyces sp. NPDC051636 TaxID=3365663 RepID=UPI00378B97D6